MMIWNGDWCLVGDVCLRKEKTKQKCKGMVDELFVTLIS